MTQEPSLDVTQDWAGVAESCTQQHTGDVRLSRVAGALRIQDQSSKTKLMRAEKHGKRWCMDAAAQSSRGGIWCLQLQELVTASLVDAAHWVWWTAACLATQAVSVLLEGCSKIRQ